LCCSSPPSGLSTITSSTVSTDAADPRGWALVTGAGRRIGAALAIAAGEAGFDVIVHVHHSEDAAAEVVDRLEALGRRAMAAPADLADPAACARLIEIAPAPLTLLVNCASVFEDDDVRRLDPARFETAMAVNLRAPLLLASAMARRLPPGVAGHVVNILDQRVWRLTPRYFSYTLSKAALWTATQTLAQALAPAIRVNAIGPGPTLASVHQSARAFAAQAAAAPLGRGPTPEEIAAALTYLIDAASVTGQMIAVDGGQHLAWRTPDVIDD
jgi:NAD(P)-dependent dehydrogenase (short-subunit alcohol dehydrogenase family)